MTETRIQPGAVVVGIDGSPSSDRALAWAIDQARLERRPLALVHAVDALGVGWTDPVSGYHHEIMEARRHDGAAMLERARAVVAERAPGLEVDVAVEDADPRSLLLELSQTARTLVVGSRGRGPIGSLLLGSVGVAVIRHAACPVVVVRPGTQGAVRHGVLVGADASPSSPATVEYAYLQASLRQLPLTILHSPRGAVDAPDDELRLRAAEPLSGLAEKYPDVRTRLLVAAGLADEEIVRSSDRMDLVVVGAHHGGRLSALVNGSVAQIVVEHARCPVAVVPLTATGVSS